MSMTKKDYELIANVLKDVKHGEIDMHERDDSVESHQGMEYIWGETCKAFALYLEEANPRFDRNKFLQACGIRTEDSEDRLAELLAEEDEHGQLSEEKWQEKNRLMNLKP